MIVGVNKYSSPDEDELDILRIGTEVETAQRERIARIRQDRDEAAVAASLETLRTAADTDANLMGLIVDAARLRATEGEIAGAMKDVFGGYREPPRV